MTYTTGNNFTAAGSYTLGTDFSFGAYTLTVPLTFTQYESYTLTVPLTFTQYETYQLQIPLTFANYEVFGLTVPLTFTQYETYQLQIPLTFKVGIFLTVPLTFANYESYQLQVPLTFANYEVFGLTVPLTFTQYETYQLQIPLTFANYEVFGLTVPLTFSQYEGYLLVVPVEFEVLSNLWTLEAGLCFVNYEVYSLSIPLSINVTELRYSLGIPLTFNVIEVYTLTVPIRLEVLPSITSGVGEQGVGGVVVNPEGHAQWWSLRVKLGSTDVSDRLIGTVTIDAEESSAAIAVFSLRASAGFIDPYSWIRKPVTIEHVSRDSGGVEIVSTLLFRGLVDTPDYDTASRVTKFSCTDNLQNIVLGMTRAEVEQLTPLSKWSRFVFDENANSWEYLQQRLGTYHYTVGLDVNGRLVVKDWQSSAIKFEFNNSTILDGSLSIALTNARSITNSITVSLSAATEIFRESVLSLRWEEGAWYTNSYLDWMPCSVQMICDAVANAGATFVDIPSFNMTPVSQWRVGPGGATFGFVNPGTELNAIEFRAKISKRWKQSVNHIAKVVVQSADSIGAVGVLPDTVEGSITSQYNETIEEFFTKTQPLNWYQSSAGKGINTGQPTWDIPPGTPIMFQGDGFVSYPMLGFSFQSYQSSQRDVALAYGFDPVSAAYDTFNRALSSGSTLEGINAHQTYQGALAYLTRLTGNIDLTQYDHLVPTTQGGTYQSVFDITGQPSGHNQPGEHVYDFDAFLVQGNQEDRQGAFDALQAQGVTKLLASHRQNRVGFSVLANSQITRGDTIRIDTSTLKARGVVHQVTHTFDIDKGSAISEVSLAISTPKSVGIPDAQVSGIVLRVPLVFEVGVSLTPAGAGRLPVTHGAFNHDIDLPCHYYSSGSPDPSWVGHISPKGYIGSNEFVITFPAIPTQDTENATINSAMAPFNVLVPQDELLISA